MSSRVFATRLRGDGTETMLVEDLPLAGVSFTRNLSGTSTISGSITPEIEGLKAPDGQPLLQAWSTALYIEQDGQIRAGGIVQPESMGDGPTLRVEAAGFAAYPYGMPYDGERYFIQVDSLDIFRHIWDHLQSQPGGDLGLRIDPDRSGVLVGEELEEVAFETGGGEEVMFEAGPFKLAWYLADDLGDRLEELVDLGGFEFTEEHAWAPGEDRIEHRLRLGVPRLGRRRHDIHFVAGDNLVRDPAFSVGTYASEVWAMGAGEGRTVRHARAGRSGESRLRRVNVVSDKALTSNRRAAEMAALMLDLSTGEPEVDSVTIRGGNPDEIPDLGDEVLLRTSGIGWHRSTDLWVRVRSVTQSLDSSWVTCEVEKVSGETSGGVAPPPESSFFFTAAWSAGGTLTLVASSGFARDGGALRISSPPVPALLGAGGALTLTEVG